MVPFRGERDGSAKDVDHRLVLCCHFSWRALLLPKNGRRVCGYYLIVKRKCKIVKSKPESIIWIIKFIKAVLLLFTAYFSLIT